MPAARIEAVLRVEVTDQNTLVSSTAAMRPIKIMPATRVDLRADRSLATDPFEPRDNILAGGVPLRGTHVRFGYPGPIAANNAGPRRT